MHRNCPDAKILLLGLFPYGVAGVTIRNKMAEVNRSISRQHDQKHVFYMDIGDGFADENGTFLSDVFMPDALHPLARGYEIWGQAVSPTLAELFR